MTDWTQRVRAIVDAHFAVIVATLVVVALLGGGLAYGPYISAGTTTETQTVTAGAATGTFNHSATVTDDTTVYPAGTTLTNRSVYFTEASPQFQGDYTFTYTGENGELGGNISLYLVQRSVKEQRDGETVVWETTEQLAERSVASLQPGETVQISFETNMSAVANETAQINSELGGPPGTPAAAIVAAVNLEGEVGGESVRHVKNHELAIAFEQSTYQITGPTERTDQYEAVQTATVDEAYGLPHRVGGPILLLTSLLGIGALWTARKEGHLGLTETEREQLAFHDDREAFDEWISTMKLPDDVFERPQAEAASLESLVDFAIDTNNSVIEDPDDNAFYVVHEGYLYSYSPPSVADGAPSALASEDEQGPLTDDSETPPIDDAPSEATDD